jgi:ubiquinone/menaquinone biosynthesis C-methylase UbiE
MKSGVRDYLSREEFELWCCDECSSLQTIGDTQGDYYGQAYYGSREGKFSPITEKIFRFFHTLKAKKFYQKFKPETVVEVGCGRGYILSILAKLGCKVVGIESAGAADWILNNPEINVHGVIDGERWPIDDHSIDLVIIWHVFEHVTEPFEVLLEMKRILTEDGAICMSVPNIDSLQARLSLRNWFHLDVPRHHFHYTQTGIEKIIDRAGMKVIQREAGDFTQNLYGWFQTLSNMMIPVENNLMYRFLQGGNPWNSVNRKTLILLNVILLPVIVTLGLLGFALELISGKHGTVTYYIQSTE